MEYTKYLENELYSFDIDDDYNSSQVITFLNTSFRTFGEGLSSIIQEIIPPDVHKSPKEYLQDISREMGITIASRNTFNNWFDKSLRPKKSNDARIMMFKVAFALELDVEKTVTLFHHVYLDRAYNKRSVNELIFYYCLNNRLPYSHAEKLISAMDSCDFSYDDKTLFSSLIGDSIHAIDSDEELLKYIVSHGHNFAYSNTKAKEVLSKYIHRAICCAQEETKEDDFCDDTYRGMTRDSINFMYYVITGYKPSSSRGTRTLTFKNTELPAEIKSNFPQPVSFSTANPSFEELRKMIILLFSYCFWRNAAKHKLFDLYDDYCDQLNDLLADCDFPTLYFGNPYDWLFLFCTFSCTDEYNSLDCFRTVLDDIQENSD